jgi:UDP-2,3-diacylglucosamine pyrophosphatase LpxH
MKKPIPDDEFMAVWLKHKSPKAVSEILGMDVRNVYSRRDGIEKKYGIVLDTDNESRKNQQRPETYIAHASREVLQEVSNGSVVVFSDAHYAPGEPTVAHKALIEVIKELKPKVVIANGDIFDGASHGVNRHDPFGWEETPTLKQEIEVVTERMNEVYKTARGSKRFWTLGNHDIRFDRYISSKAGELRGLHGTRLMDYFKEWSPSWSVKINSTTMVKHRWHNGVHATYNNILKSGLECMVTGHLHRLIVTSWGDYTGRKWGVDTGTLADPKGPQFEYLENNPTPWCSGFAVLTFKDGKLLPPELCEVIRDEAFFRGERVL